MTDAKVRVRFDTRQATGQLRALVRESRATAGKVTGAVRSSVGAGLGAVGLGGGIGAGIAATQAATRSGFGDIVGETFGGLSTQLEQFFLGDLGEEARASRSAREETIQAFGAIAGATNSVPPEAKNFFEQVRSLRKQEEHGRTLFQADSDFRGPGLDDLIERIVTKIGEELMKAAEHLASKLNPFG